MKILVAPDKFKGSLTAVQAAARIAEGLRRVWPEAEIVQTPVADGGEGTARSLCEALGGKWVEREVPGPLGRPVRAGYAWMEAEKLAVVEMSEASGLALVPLEERRATQATTRGTGYLMRDAVRRGARRIIVGLGGSATTDGGVGMAAALGVRFLDEAGGEIPAPVPDDFPAIAKIDLSRRMTLPEVIAASDVLNPLLGERGAARLFSPQKGATPEEVEALEAALAHMAHLCERGPELAETPGAGAAGGLGFGVMAFAGATLRTGFDLVAEVLGLEEQVRAADLVVTGEGSLDLQTLEGKGPAGLARLARKHGKPVVALGGRVVNDARLYDCFDAVMPLANEPMPLAEAIAEAGPLLEAAAERVARLINLGRID